VSAFPAFAVLNRHLQLVLRIDRCWVHQGGFFPLFGFPVGHATLKAVMHASVNLFTVLSSSCGLVMISDGYMGRIFVRTSLYLCQSARLGLAKLTGKGESRDNTVFMDLWSEKECSSGTEQFFTPPSSESDTKVRSMIAWQVLVMNVGTLPLLHKNKFEFRIKLKRDSPLSLTFGQPHWV